MTNAKFVKDKEMDQRKKTPTPLLSLVEYCGPKEINIYARNPTWRATLDKESTMLSPLHVRWDIINIERNCGISILRNMT
jgi:hypothetical protein